MHTPYIVPVICALLRDRMPSMVCATISTFTGIMVPIIITIIVRAYFSPLAKVMFGEFRKR